MGIKIYKKNYRLVLLYQSDRVVTPIHNKTGEVNTSPADVILKNLILYCLGVLAVY